jgi:hypothetical protein
MIIGYYLHMKYVAITLTLIIAISPVAHANKLIKTNFHYDIQWGNLKIGNISVFLERKSNDIKLKAKSKSEGAISFLYNYKSDLVASSYKRNEIWRASSYIVNSKLRDKLYYSKVFWNKEDNNLKYEIDPPLDLEKVYDVPQSTLKNVIDPITAILKVIEKINKNKPCNSKLSIFDGRRRYNLSAKELENQYLVNDRPRSFKGDTVVCGVKITPIGGHWIDSEWKPEMDKFSDIKVFFRSGVKGFHLPVRINLSRWFGTITVRLLKHNS